MSRIKHRAIIDLDYGLAVGNTEPLSKLMLMYHLWDRIGYISYKIFIFVTKSTIWYPSFVCMVTIVLQGDNKWHIVAWAPFYYNMI